MKKLTPLQTLMASAAILGAECEATSKVADAMLIDAAPDLLAACKEALKRVALLTPFTVGECDPIIEKAISDVAAEADETRKQLRAAIDKAEGISRHND